MPAAVAIIGSINMDVVAHVRTVPAAGQTVHGEALHLSPGGKGANQAVAAAQLGARVQMLGRVGDDAFGPVLLAGLSGAGVGTEAVLPVGGGVSSGTAVILVEGSGQNRIVVNAGANGCLREADVLAFEPVLRQCDVCLLQLETPLASVAAAVALCRRLGVRVVLDAAPVPPEPPGREILGVDVLSPNLGEAAALLGVECPAETLEQAERLGRLLLASSGAGSVVVKAGSAGAVWVEPGRVRVQRALRVEVVDTTAAGDAFTAGLAVGLGEGLEASAALLRACAAGALACTRRGAQEAMPGHDEVVLLLSRDGGG